MKRNNGNVQSGAAIIGVFLLALLVAGLGVAFFLAQNNQNIGSKAYSPTPSGPNCGCTAVLAFINSHYDATNCPVDSNSKVGVCQGGMDPNYFNPDLYPYASYKWSLEDYKGTKVCMGRVYKCPNTAKEPSPFCSPTGGIERIQDWCTLQSCGGDVSNCTSCPEGYKWCMNGGCRGSCSMYDPAPSPSPTPDPKKTVCGWRKGDGNLSTGINGQCMIKVFSSKSCVGTPVGYRSCDQRNKCNADGTGICYEFSQSGTVNSVSADISMTDDKGQSCNAVNWTGTTSIFKKSERLSWGCSTGGKINQKVTKEVIPSINLPPGNWPTTPIKDIKNLKLGPTSR